MCCENGQMSDVHFPPVQLISLTAPQTDTSRYHDMESSVPLRA